MALPSSYKTKLNHSPVGEKPGALCVGCFIDLFIFKGTYFQPYFAHGFDGQCNGMVRKYPDETCVCVMLSG